MSEENKAIVRRYYQEIWSEGELSLVDELFSPNYENHDPATPGEVLRGREAFKQFVGGFRTAFPDLKITITEQYAEGDTVVSGWTAGGTQRGPLMGMPASGRAGAVRGVTITHFAGGKIVRDDAVWDTLGLLKQLGAVPA